MRKRNLIFPLIIGSILIPSIESKTINDSFENEYAFYKTVEIANGNFGPTGSNRNAGGIMTVEQKKQKWINEDAKSIQFFKH